MAVFIFRASPSLRALSPLRQTALAGVQYMSMVPVALVGFTCFATVEILSAVSNLGSGILSDIALSDTAYGVSAAASTSQVSCPVAYATLSSGLTVCLTWWTDSLNAALLP
ncbi:hypothetical protein BD309DRAFT_968239 [Dichomitus squalens]|nr:hypothetical protein BD309DRAFT_968239 [Dichomitus squalens]